MPGIVVIPPPDTMLKSGLEPELIVTFTSNGSDPPLVILKVLVSMSELFFFVMLKLNDLGETESLLDELMSGTTNDCADAGGANAASRNNNEKPRPTSDRVSELLKRIDKSLPNDSD